MLNTYTTYSSLSTGYCFHGHFSQVAKSLLLEQIEVANIHSAFNVVNVFVGAEYP